MDNQLVVVRRFDDLGRIVIPKELRKVLHIKENDQYEIYVNTTDETITLKRYRGE